MSGAQINRMSGRIMAALSLVALLAVISGYTQPRQTDEGTAAHIFQLSIGALIPTILVFAVTFDWKTPGRSARLVALSAAALIFAFAGLYYLEHVR